jgi:hypothetical protein
MTLRPALLALLILASIPVAVLPTKAGAEEKKKDKGTYVNVETLTAMVIAPNGRHQVMTVQSGVDVTDPALHTLAEQVEPRLRDAYVQVLQAYAGGLTPGAPPDPDYVARQLQAATDRVLGKKGGKLLIGGMMIN